MDSEATSGRPVRLDPKLHGEEAGMAAGPAYRGFAFQAPGGGSWVALQDCKHRNDRVAPISEWLC